MKKFKCILVRTQYQTVVVKAKDWQEANELACERFDHDLLLDDEYVEVYDTEEVTK